MDVTGRLNDVYRTLEGRLCISFTVDAQPSRLGLDELRTDLLDITAQKHRRKRSLNANALLWKCIGDIAAAIGADKWEVYLKMLKRYGAFTYVCVKPGAVEMLKRQWRECEEVGLVKVGEQTAVQMLCYYGSSTYDTKQFSRLLDGVISEMEEIGIETPTSEQMRRSLEQWEKDHG